MKSITTLLEEGAVLGDGGYLIELERRGYVDSGSRREKVGTGKGSGQFTPEVAIENPDALRELHREFLKAGSQVLQALTFFGTREKLDRAGYGAQTEAINHAAVRIARAVAGSVSRTQLIEREGPGALGHAKDLMAEQIRLLKDAGADFLILETFFRLDEMLAALDAAKASGLPAVATLSFHPLITKCSDDHTPAHWHARWPTRRDCSWGELRAGAGADAPAAPRNARGHEYSDCRPTRRVPHHRPVPLLHTPTRLPG